MVTSRNSHLASRSPQATQPTHAASRWLTAAVALCGALAGGSIVEAIAALALRTNTPIAPDHLIAEPLVIAGAICGGLLAAVIAGKGRREDQRQDDQGQKMSAIGSIMAVDITPGEPMIWPPAPQVVPLNQPQSASAIEPPPSTSFRHLPRKRRLVSQRIQRHRAARVPLSRPPVTR